MKSKYIERPTAGCATGVRAKVAGDVLPPKASLPSLPQLQLLSHPEDLLEALQPVQEPTKKGKP